MALQLQGRQSGPALSDLATRRAEAGYRSLVRASVSDVWRTDPHGAVLDDMPQWRAVTGQTEQQLLGTGWQEGIHPDDRPRVAQTWAAALAAQSLYECEYRIRPVAGTGPGRIVVARGLPIVEDGCVQEWVGTTVDVTEARRAQAKQEELGARVVVAAHRAGRLQHVTAALSRAVTVDEVVTVILEHGRSGIGATGCGLALLDATGSAVTYQALHGYGPDLSDAWSTFPLQLHTPVTEVVRTGHPLFLSGTAAMRARFPGPEMADFLAGSGERAWVRLPLATTGRSVGALAFGFLEEREFPAEERDFLTALAAQCAQALERARLYERERSTAVLLQRALQPDRLPTIAGVELAARYAPGTVGVEVGGDWYDAFPVHDGRLALVVGDVMGKGPRAAAVMGQVRNALRAYAVIDPEPCVVLERLDRLFASLADDEELVTLVYAVFDPATGRLVNASAGHPPALVVEAAGELTELSGGRSMPLGLGEADRPQAVRVLLPGATLLLYTDGLVEDRSRSLGDGILDLQTVLKRTFGSSVEQLCDNVLDRMGVQEPEDDVTVLACRIAACPTGAGR